MAGEVGVWRERVGEERVEEGCGGGDGGGEG